MDWEEFGAKIARKEKKAPRLAARRSQVGPPHVLYPTLALIIRLASAFECLKQC